MIHTTFYVYLIWPLPLYMEVKLLFFVCPIVSDFIAQKATFILNFAYSG
ncbi:hypothetical protein Hanom_Chr02g00133561 [Helianthus anomalus]